MALGYLNRKIRVGYKAFCEETSIHGFLELYRAKHWFWKLVWIVLLFASFSITLVQLNGSIDQFIHQTTITSIEPANEDDVIYPPLKYCNKHVLLWLDFDSLKSISKQTLMLAISHLKWIDLRDINFNLTEAEYNLDRLIQKKRKKTANPNYTVKDFFIEHSRQLSVGDVGINPNEMALINNEIYMCMIVNETNIRNGLDESGRLKIQFPRYNEYYVNQDEEDFNTVFNKREMYAVNDIEPPEYLTDALTDTNITDLMYFDMTVRSSFVDTLVVDSFNNQYLVFGEKFSEYFIDIKLSVQKLIPRETRKCKLNVKSTIMRKEICTEKCSWISYTYENFFSPDNIIENTSLHTTCQPLNGLVLRKERIHNFLSICKTLTFSVNEDSVYYTHEKVNGNSDETLFNECFTECNEGCQKWKWDMFYVPIGTLSENPGYIDVTIQYSTVDNVFVLKESDSKSWEDFVSSVGGLLGIWTGASVLSLLQLAYLFCCPPEDTVNSGSAKVKKFNVKRKNIKTVSVTPLNRQNEDEAIVNLKLQIERMNIKLEQMNIQLNNLGTKFLNEK